MAPATVLSRWVPMSSQPWEMWWVTLWKPWAPGHSLGWIGMDRWKSMIKTMDRAEVMAPTQPIFWWFIEVYFMENPMKIWMIYDDIYIYIHEKIPFLEWTYGMMTRGTPSFGKLLVFWTPHGGIIRNWSHDRRSTRLQTSAPFSSSHSVGIPTIPLVFYSSTHPSSIHPPSILVGGLEHHVSSIFFKGNSSQLTHIFKRGGSTTNQNFIGI